MLPRAFRGETTRQAHSMNSFTDYYAILGVALDAPPDAIKAAFKKLARQYHPDVYKGEDAHERMSALLLAYHTLNDPAARKQYDIQRSEHMLDGRAYRASSVGTPPNSSMPRRSGANASQVSPSARRDRQRHYDFPDIRGDAACSVDLIDIQYQLSPTEAQTLQQQGILRGTALKNEEGQYFCHRCHHRWSPSATEGQRGWPRFCPKCHASDWAEYLLLRCIHCCAVFESEQIRYEIGSYTYGRDRQQHQAGLCPPYELFPLCPYCGNAHWCPAEDVRVEQLRLQNARRAAMQRMFWMSVVIVAIVVLGVVALGVMK